MLSEARVAGALSLFVVGILVVSACTSHDDGQVTDSANGSSSAPRELPGEVEEQMSAALVEVMDSYSVPGAVVAVSTPAGSWHAEEGVSDLETGEPIAEGQVWPLRSLTKSFTVTVLLLLVEEGVVALDDPISDYVEGVPNGDDITLRQLADMTSGVGDYTRSDAFLESFVSDTDQEFTLDQLNSYGLAEGSQFPPGTDAIYSNTAPNLLGVVIEEVTGQAVGEVIEERVLTPLGLMDTVYPTAEADWAEPHATGYQPEGDDALGAMFNNFSSMGASGAMISTSADMEIWAEALGSGSLIAPDLQPGATAGTPAVRGSRVRPLRRWYRRARRLVGTHR